MNKNEQYAGLNTLRRMIYNIKEFVSSKIAEAISSVYKPHGSVVFSELPALSVSVLGNVYNINEDFTTTTDFVEGAGKKYPANTNVVVVDTDTTGNSPVYKFDVFTGLVDMSPYQEKTQYSALSEPSAELVDKIFQYVGATDTDFTNGYFYTCVKDNENPDVYKWVHKPVQKDIDVDVELDDLSTNPVENRAVKKAVNERMDVLLQKPAESPEDEIAFIWGGSNDSRFTKGHCYKYSKNISKYLGYDNYLFVYYEAKKGDHIYEDINLIPLEDTIIEEFDDDILKYKTSDGVIHEAFRTEDADLKGEGWIEVVPEDSSKLTVSDKLPAEARWLGKQILYVGESTSGLVKGGIYESQVELVTPNGNENPSEQNWLIKDDDFYYPSRDSTVQSDMTYYVLKWVLISTQKIQYPSLPEPSEFLEGKIFQYTGPTDQNLINGYFYICERVADSDPTEYEWKPISANPLSEGDAIDLTNDTVSVKFDDDTIKVDDTTGKLKVDEKFKRVFIGTRSQWDALTLAEKKEYDEADLTDDLAGGDLVVSDTVTEGDLNPVTSNAVAKAVNYSTDEVKTGATWIDGKPIYRKVFTGLTRSSAAGQWIDTGANVTGMNIGIIICFNAYDSTTAINRNAIDMRIDAGKLKYYTGFENPFDVCTLEYTKTTD